MQRLFRVVALCALAAAVLSAACKSSTAADSTKAYDIAGGLQKIDTVVGTGAEAVNGKTAVMAYTGWLYDPNAAGTKGKQFDTSTSFSFLLGARAVILGWDQGVIGMKVGGKRTLLIPAGLGYGGGGNGTSVPGGSGLVFDLELLDIQ